MFLKLNHVPIVLYISSKVMGGGFGTLRTRGKGGFGRGNSSRSSICTCYRSLTLSVPVPEVISVQPSIRVCCIKILSAIHVFEPLVRIRSRIVRAN